MVIKVGETGYIPDCAIIDPKRVYGAKELETSIPIVKAAFKKAGWYPGFEEPRIGMIWIPSFFAHDLGNEDSTKGMFVWCIEKTSGEAGFFIGVEEEPSKKICINSVHWLGEYYSESHWDGIESNNRPKTLIM